MRAIGCAAPWLLLTLAACASEGATDIDAGDNGQDDAAVGVDAGQVLDAGTPASCMPVLGPEQACGGDITGSWRYVDVCGIPDAFANFIAMCPETVVTLNTHTITGTAGFSQDGIYGWRLRDSFHVAMEVPVSCTTSSGGCEPFGFLVGLGLGQPVSCTARDQLCDCTVTGMTQDAQNGRYGIAGGTVTTTRTDGRHRDYYFCVSGQRANLRKSNDGIVFLIER